MTQPQASIEATLAQFEGLVLETARQIVSSGVELEFEDIAQLLRIKVWRAVVAYDSAHERRLPLRNFVFGCLYNMRKDILKRPRRYNASVEAARARPAGITEGGAGWADVFDGRYLSIDAEVVYAEVECEEIVLPCTLTAIERRVIALRMAGRLLIEIDAELGLSRSQREAVMVSVRAKLADWAPSVPSQRCVPTPPLPHVSPGMAAHV